jgi:hypothetical protein
MQHSNAILAINSLDRYLSISPLDLDFAIFATWNVATPNIITLEPGYAGIVGATLVYAGGVNGWPDDVTVTITAVNGSLITISAPVTATEGTPQNILQKYSFDTGNPQQPKANSLLGQYRSLKPFCNDFTITSPGALIYGYINRIIVSQIQVQYNIPTICLNRNDRLAIYCDPLSIFTSVQIPFGFYTPDELADAMTAIIAATPAFAPLDIVVTYDLFRGFVFTSQTAVAFYFPEPEAMLAGGELLSSVQTILKTYRVFGINQENADSIGGISQVSSVYPNFLYTPYIDIYSDVLTNYQNIKDTNTSVEKPKGLVARIYLSGVSNPVPQTGTTALGSTPFVMTADLNTPKVIQWSPDVAVPSIDFQLRDCYGELIPGDSERYPTEFQMTLLCIEGR